MRIVDDKFLKTLRGRGRCEMCGKPCSAREVHHVIAKGMGGGRQLDIAINVVSVGSSSYWQCTCHSTKADSQEGQAACWRIVAAREGLSVEVIQEVCYWILRLPSRPSRTQTIDALKDLSRPAFLIAVFTLAKHGKL